MAEMVEKLVSSKAGATDLVDAWDRVDRLTQGMSTCGFFDDLDDVWLETLMSRERCYHMNLRHVVALVFAVSPVLAPGAIVDPSASPGGVQP